MATKSKIAAKPAPAPAPAPETEQEEGVVLEVGTTIRFIGYGADVAEEDQLLTAGETYTVAGFTEPAAEGEEGNPFVQASNPNFNAKKKEHPDTNPRFIDVEVLAEELEVVEAEPEPEPVKAPAQKVAAKTAPAQKTAAAAPAKTAAKVAVGSGGTGKQVAPAKKVAAKKVPAAPKEEVPEVDPLEVDLATEDADVLALVSESADLIATAQELAATAAQTEWQLGGLLYHIKKDGSYKALAEAYAEKGGFEKFVNEHFAMEYRKAMHLIEIYVFFNQAGIEDAGARVTELGWTKAKTVARHLVGENAKPEELLELASNSTVEVLSEAIRDSIRVGGTKGELKKRVTLKFRYLEEEGNGILEIIQAAKEAFGLKKDDEALARIADVERQSAAAA